MSEACGWVLRLLRRGVPVLATLAIGLSSGAPRAATIITEIIDSSGDGVGNLLNEPLGIAVDAARNVYVAGAGSQNAFMIDPNGVITEIIDATGDGAGNPLGWARGVAVDGSGNVYVLASGTDNAFRIDPNGMITEIIDTSGDGAGAPLLGASAIAADGLGNVYVTGAASDNAFRIDPNGGITEILDSAGDGAGAPLDQPFGIAVDGLRNVYVTGTASHNAFKLEPDLDGDGIPDGKDPCPVFPNTLPINGGTDCQMTAQDGDPIDPNADCNGDRIPNECQCAGFNLNGHIDIQDALFAFNCIQPANLPASICDPPVLLGIGDANNNGIIDTHDALFAFNSQPGGVFAPNFMTCPNRPPPDGGPGFPGPPLPPEC